MLALTMTSALYEVFPKLGCPFGVPYCKEYGILGVYIGVPVILVHDHVVLKPLKLQQSAEARACGTQRGGGRDGS